MVSVPEQLLEEGEINRLGFLKPRRQMAEGKSGIWITTKKVSSRASTLADTE